MDTNNKIKKCIKSYLCGRKHLIDDKNKALDYFNKALLIFYDIDKNDDKNDDFDKNDDMLNEIYRKTMSYIKTLRDDLFVLVEEGDINKVKKYYNQKNSHEDFYIYNDDGFTPMHYAIKNGDTLFLKYAFSLGVHIDTPDKKNGHTLLEYACLLGDPNMINFMIMNGANIKKHQEFRNSVKYYNQNKQIDYNLILKYILTNCVPSKNNLLDFVFKYIDPNGLAGIDNITVKEFIMRLEDFLLKIPIVSKQSLVNILKEELTNDNMCAYVTKLEILLYNIVPFIDYPFDLSLRWLIILEIEYLSTKMKSKDELHQNLNERYIKNYLLPNDFMQNLISK